MEVKLQRKFRTGEILAAIAVFALSGVMLFVDFGDAILYFRNGQAQEGFAELGKHYLSTLVYFLFLLMMFDLERSNRYLMKWVCLSSIFFSLVIAILIRQDIVSVTFVFVLALLIFVVNLFKIEKTEGPLQEGQQEQG